MSTGKRVAVVTGAIIYACLQCVGPISDVLIYMFKVDVTGSNKGIGYEIVRGICKQFDGDVILTARNPELGQKAVKSLQEDGCNPVFHQLDISDKESIQTLKKFIEQQYGGLDILVNNAAISFKRAATETFDVQARESMKTNFWGTVDVCEALFPLLRPHARVAHMGGFVSARTFKNCSEEIQRQLLKNDNTLKEVKDLMSKFVEDTKDLKHKEKGWAESAYGMTKVGVYLLTVVQQREFDKSRPGDDIAVNCCCPGWVQTDMSGQSGNKTPAQGAETPIYASLLPANSTGPKSQFLSKKTAMEWPGRIGDEDYLK